MYGYASASHPELPVECAQRNAKCLHGADEGRVVVHDIDIAAGLAELHDDLPINKSAVRQT